MPARRRPWPDVPRLLTKRSEFRQLLGDPELAGSVTAFIAWKAFLIVARGIAEGDEKRQVREVFRVALSPDRDVLWDAASRFASALRGIALDSPALIAEWYADQAWEPTKRDSSVEWAKRSIRRLSDGLNAKQRLPELAELLADHAYAVRNAVIAHGAVHTNANHFHRVVPAFEQLVCLVTCAGYAARAGLPLTIVLEECHAAPE